MNKLLEIKRISHTKEKGRVRKFRVIFIFGNKTGWVGFGRGKSFFIAGALLKAKQNALKNIKYVHLNSLKTIPHVIIYKFKKTKIILKPSYVGGGLRAPLFIKPLLEISGYKNLGFIIIGSSNKLNVFNSFFFSMTTVVSKKELFNLDLLNFNTNKAAQPFNSILNLLIHC